jgi:hypothetical protein
LNLIKGERGVEERGQAWRWRHRTVLDRCIADADYRGHNAPPEHKFKVYTSGQKRRVTPRIKHEFKRHAAIEPVIGHLKEHHRIHTQAATPSMPCSPRPAITSAAPSHDWVFVAQILIALDLAATPPSGGHLKVIPPPGTPGGDPLRTSPS